MLYLDLGSVLCEDFTELVKYVKYITWSLSMQNVCAKDIVDSISTALCFFLHSNIINYGYLMRRQCLTSCNIGIELNIAWNAYFGRSLLIWFTVAYPCRLVKLDWNIKWKNKIKKWIMLCTYKKLQSKLKSRDPICI